MEEGGAAATRPREPVKAVDVDNTDSRECNILACVLHKVMERRMEMPEPDEIEFGCHFITF